jgi:hypothetical protein
MPALLVSVAAIAVGGAVAAAAISASGSSAHKQKAPTVHGTLTLVGGGYTTYNPCDGINNGLVDNSDMKSYTPVKILNASGTIVGTGYLGTGAVVRDPLGYRVCRFSFDIKLDAASKHYQLVVADRQPYDFDNPSALDVSLGGPN